MSLLDHYADEFCKLTGLITHAVVRGDELIDPSYE